MRQKKKVEIVVSVEDTITNPEKRRIYLEAKSIIEVKKIITADVKEKLIELGFKEVVIGTKKIHQIKSKEVKIDFVGYDIAIGIFARAISYGEWGRQFRAMAIKINQ